MALEASFCDLNRLRASSVAETRHGGRSRFPTQPQLTFGTELIVVAAVLAAAAGALDQHGDPAAT